MGENKLFGPTHFVFSKSDFKEACIDNSIRAILYYNYLNQEQRDNLKAKLERIDSTFSQFLDSIFEKPTKKS